MYKVGRSRTPQGVRGLKLIILHEVVPRFRSHSARSAWIETSQGDAVVIVHQSHSARSAWIETSGVRW